MASQSGSMEGPSEVVKVKEPVPAEGAKVSAPSRDEFMLALTQLTALRKRFETLESAVSSLSWERI